jgi:hypothetical protein
MQALTNEQITHFRKRRKQLVMGGAAIGAVVLGIALLLFQRDLEAAQLQQKWSLWRDDNCTRMEGAVTSAAKNVYSSENLNGAPGTWRCRDGSTHVLQNSDLPPANWKAPPSVD